MKTIASFSTPAEAHVAMSRLISAGIAAAIRDEHTIALDWLVSNAIGGVKIEVPEDEVAAAREILELPPPDAGVLRCPYCGSHEAQVRVLSAFGAACVILKLPIPLPSATVDCRNCKKSYKVALNGR